MGLFDFLSGGKGGSLKKTVEKANNKHSQSIDRFKALESLRDDGSEEALLGLLRRFSFVYDKTIEDEQEKQWIHDTLVEIATSRADGEQDGEARDRVLAALQKNLVGAETISLALRVLEHIADADHAWPVLEKVIEANDNEYVRDPSRKIQLVDFLGEFDDDRAAEALLQYLEDVDEGVRYHTIEALLHLKREEIAREALLTLLVKPEEESRRIKIRILDGLADLGWPVQGFRGTVEKLCEEIGRGHSVDGKGRIKKGAQR